MTFSTKNFAPSIKTPYWFRIHTYYNYIGIHPGEYGCEDSRQCEAFFPHSTCSSEGKCHCPSGYQLQTILFPTGNVQQANNKQSTCVLRK